MAGWARTFKASARLEETAGDLSDMGLSEQELRLTPRLIPGGAKLLTGDPSARFSNAFSPSVTGDIGAGNPMRAKSKGGMVADASQKCGGVLGPAAPVVVSGDELGWEPDGLGWDPDARGSNTEFVPNSSSNERSLPAPSLGILYGLGRSLPLGLVTHACTQSG